MMLGCIKELGEGPMQVQVINFQLQGIDAGEYSQMCEHLAPTVAEVPGLIAKMWLADPASNTYGGVYTWRDEQAMRDFAAGELFQAVKNNPHLTNVTSRTFGVLEGPTAITRGLAVALV
jgi:heme-degrading monooxygenase HmoA